MTNGEFLQFIYNRLIEVHKENPNYDYMRRLKELEEVLTISGQLAEMTEANRKKGSYIISFYEAANISDKSIEYLRGISND